MPTPLPIHLETDVAPTPTGDALLVRRALAGETEAVDRVVERLSCVVRFVHRLNRSLGYHLSVDALQDVVQQVHAAMWPRLVDYHGGSALESWAFGFCRNCLRAEARRNLGRGASLGTDDEPVGPGPEPVELVARRERLDALRDELERLPADERRVVVLRHLDDRSFEQIAEVLHLPASTVKDRCYRALRKVAERLRRRDVCA